MGSERLTFGFSLLYAVSRTARAVEFELHLKLFRLHGRPRRCITDLESSAPLPSLERLQISQRFRSSAKVVLTESLETS